MENLDKDERSRSKKKVSSTRSKGNSSHKQKARVFSPPPLIDENTTNIKIG
jgi:hypothetical protein